MIKWYWSVIHHKILVMWYIIKFCSKLLWRGVLHDNSKFSGREARLFATVLPRLKESTYGSKEYTKLLESLKPVLDFHYKNRHHIDSLDE